MRIPFDNETWEKHGSPLEMLVYRNGEKPDDAHFFKYLTQLNRLQTTRFGCLLSHYDNGSIQSKNNELDLFLELPDEIVERWVNIYPPEVIRDVLPQNSREKAKNAALNNRVAIIKLTFTNGQLTATTPETI